MTLPRLTRAEYRNTLRDLLGVDLRAGEDLPEDGEGPSGFVNDRDALALSPAAMELYFDAAASALDGAFALARKPGIWRFEAEEMTRTAPRMPVAPRGVALVHPNHEVQAMVRFPVDGWYEFRLAGAVSGRACVAQFRVDGEVVAEARVTSEDYRRAPVARAFGFVRAGMHPFSATSKNLVPHPVLPPGIVKTVDERAAERAARLPAPSGGESAAAREAREALNSKSHGVQECYEWLRALGPDGDPRDIDLRRVYLAERRADWEKLRDRHAAAIGISPDEADRRWREQNAVRLADNERLLAAVAHVKWEDWTRYQGKLQADWIEVVGPVAKAGSAETADWNLVAALRSDPAPLPLLRDFLERAFRRPVGEAEIGRYEKIVRDAQRRGEDREAALKLAMSAALVSPRFLFRPEGREGRALDGYDLASRLSYFLWLSGPDGRLLDLAATGDLARPDVLAAEAGRMLADPRADAFFGAFADDWLGIRNLGGAIAPDPERFPEFTPELALAMRGEAVRTLAGVFRGGGALTDLLGTGEATLNETLARHYGVEGVSGPDFRRVKVDDPNRGGLLGLGAVLVATSSPARTNPVRRGAWVLERVLGEDPGEPRPNAGELPGNAGERRGKTLREELESHRSRPDCARCHDRIDPVGFALQNYDATGRWRDTEAGRPVDARGRLPGGAAFDGPGGLRDALVARRADFVENVTARLLAFALGRKVEYFDRAAVKAIAAETLDRDASARALVEAVVRADAFRFRETGD